MGKYKKVFLTFKHIFWPPSEPFIGLIRTEAQENRVRKNGKSSGIGPYLQLDNLWARDGIPCLEATLVGNAAEWATGQTDEIIKDEILHFIQDAMGDVMKGLLLTKLYLSCHITRWEEDCLSRGAYSGFVLGTSDKHVEELLRPEWGGRLLFAGEAAVVEYEGSVHGALISGAEVSEKVFSVLSCSEARP